MKKILCPTDFSDTAINAVEYAGRFAAKIGAEITLLNVQPLLLTDLQRPDLDVASKLEIKEYDVIERLQATANGLKETFDIHVEYELESHDIERSIIKSANEKGYDLIIMGTNGDDDLYQYFFGSHTWHVIDHVGCPVLVVPEDCVYTEINAMVYASNYSKKDIETLRKSLDLVRPFEPEINILHVSQHHTSISEDVYKAFVDEFEEAFEDKVHKLNFDRVVSDDIAWGIEKYMNNKLGDLLVILTRHRNFPEKILKRNISRQITEKVNYPIMVFHMD